MGVNVSEAGSWVKTTTSKLLGGSGPGSSGEGTSRGSEINAHGWRRRRLKHEKARRIPEYL